jgi:hypothetical protein
MIPLQSIEIVKQRGCPDYIHFKTQLKPPTIDARNPVFILCVQGGMGKKYVEDNFSHNIPVNVVER